VGRRIHSSPEKGVSGAIFEWAPSQFTLTVYKSTKAVGADKSIRRIGKRVSRATSEWAATKFSFTVYESPGAVWADESIRHL
jgi:hypothetical protein